MIATLLGDSVECYVLKTSWSEGPQQRGCVLRNQKLLGTPFQSRAVSWGHLSFTLNTIYSLNLTLTSLFISNNSICLQYSGYSLQSNTNSMRGKKSWENITGQSKYLTVHLVSNCSVKYWFSSAVTKLIKLNASSSVNVELPM